MGKRERGDWDEQNSLALQVECIPAVTGYRKLGSDGSRTSTGGHGVQLMRWDLQGQVLTVVSY